MCDRSLCVGDAIGGGGGCGDLGEHAPPEGAFAFAVLGARSQPRGGAALPDFKCLRSLNLSEPVPGR